MKELMKTSQHSMASLQTEVKALADLAASSNSKALSEQVRWRVLPVHGRAPQDVGVQVTKRITEVLASQREDTAPCNHEMVLGLLK